jgi:hypothetical protein
MPPTIANPQALETVRGLERARIEAMRANNIDALDRLMDEDLVYITSVGSIYNKEVYLNALRSHGLSYSLDFDVTETECRVLDNIVILIGMMLGHARMDGEQQVFHLRCMSIWRQQTDGWKFVAWQSSAIQRMPTP